ncbi:hypothetical protein F5Y06DRAFT_96756 [Hypoxylon sp. FL0890]|nr:hypothetical protein F5Y06DRAFT_96756 [Hypoxylon sp. FL0890]
MALYEILKNIIETFKPPKPPKPLKSLKPLASFTTLKEYRQRAKWLVKQHQTLQGQEWFIEDGSRHIDSPTLEEYITAFARGDSLGAKREHYTCIVLDEYQVFAQHVDFLIDETGLIRPPGARDCAWNYDEYTRGRDECFLRKVSELRTRLTQTHVIAWSPFALPPHLPYLYLAACVHETEMSGWRGRETLLRAVSLLDKRVMLLRARYNWLERNELHLWDLGQRDCFSKYRLIADEARRGNHDFRDVEKYRERLKDVPFCCSDEFLDELFGPQLPRWPPNLWEEYWEMVERRSRGLTY